MLNLHNLVVLCWQFIWVQIEDLRTVNTCICQCIKVFFASTLVTTTSVSVTPCNTVEGREKSLHLHLLLNSISNNNWFGASIQPMLNNIVTLLSSINVT